MCRGQQGWAQFVPKGLFGAGERHDALPLIDLAAIRPTTVAGFWLSAPLEARFAVTDHWLGGFIASIQVTPWKPGAILVLNYTFSDVRIQRLWNGDLLDVLGNAANPFTLVMGAAEPLFVVRLHNQTQQSSRGQLPDSIGFMAIGTPQTPGLAIGFPAGLPVFSYSLIGRASVGFSARVTVRPWSSGSLVQLDLRWSPRTTITAVRGAEAVSVHAGVYVVRLTSGVSGYSQPGSDSEAGSDDVTPVEAAFEIRATGAPAMPRITLMA
jgi:hypothetical protein